MAEIERAGVPTASFVTRDFIKPWGLHCAQYGVTELPRVVMPRPFAGMQKRDIDRQVDALFDGLMNALTASPLDTAANAEAGDESAIVIEDDDAYGALDRMNREFLEYGWGDGFPLCPPTRERVDSMLAGTRRSPQDVVATLAPGMGIATVEKIAINAVMAGCAPGHLPVLIAAVEAINDPRFLLSHVSISTGAHAPLMLLNGPIVRELGVNAGACALGPGAPSAVNTVLGRALRLVYMNVAHAYPGVLDVDTLGSPNKYSMCLAENEAASPWAPYHVERGFDREASVVTVFTTYALSEVEDGTGTTPEALMKLTCTSACNMGPKSVGSWLLGNRADQHAKVPVPDHHLLLVCPVHAEIFRKHGWGRREISEYLYQQARIPFGPFMARSSAASFRSAHPELQWMWESPDTLFPVLESADCFQVAVAGGASGARSTYSYGAAAPVSRLIEP
jgi:hypothetical protein